MNPEYFFDVAQGSEDWHRLRLGIPTASEFKHVILGTTKREKTARDTYMRKLAGEILTGRPVTSPDLPVFRRGHAVEPEALAWYAMMHDAEITPVGFVRLDRVGASPDGLVGKDGLIECKSADPHIQIARLESDGELPAEFAQQVDGQLLVCTDRHWLDFVSYCAGLPTFVTRVIREDRRRQIATLRVDLDMFISELDALVKRLEDL